MPHFSDLLQFLLPINWWLFLGFVHMETETVHFYFTSETFSVNIALYQEMCLLAQNYWIHCHIHAGPVGGAVAISRKYTEDRDDDMKSGQNIDWRREVRKGQWARRWAFEWTNVRLSCTHTHKKKAKVVFWDLITVGPSLEKWLHLGTKKAREKQNFSKTHVHVDRVLASIHDQGSSTSHLLCNVYAETARNSSFHVSVCASVCVCLRVNKDKIFLMVVFLWQTLKKNRLKGRQAFESDQALSHICLSYIQVHQSDLWMLVWSARGFLLVSIIDDSMSFPHSFPQSLFNQRLEIAKEEQPFTTLRIFVFQSNFSLCKGDKAEC